MPPATLPQDDAPRLREFPCDGPAAAAADSDPVFDHICELARHIAGTEIAMLSLADADLLQCKTSVGLELDAATLPSRGSLCGYTILCRDPLIVADASRDVRFAHNPLVTAAPHIRFYGGFPLITRAGFQLGSLCVISRSEGHLSAGQVDSLQRLAALAVHHWEQLRLARPSVHSLPAPLPSLVPASLLSSSEILQDLESWLSRIPAAPLALMRCRLRDHERIHATFGEALAEACLEEAARRIQHCLPATVRIGWIAPQELVLLWPDPPPSEALKEWVQRLTASVGRLHRVGDVSVVMAMVMGVVRARPYGESSESLLADGALALQRASRSQGSSWHCLDDESRGPALESFRFASQFHAALLDRDLMPAFQPIVDLPTGQPRGFEALVRWDHQGQLLPPDRFMPQARDAGVTGEVDLLMVEKTLASLPQLAQAMTPGRAAGAPMLMSLNLSGCLLGDPALRERLLQRLRHATLPAGWTLQVELLEEAFQPWGASSLDPFLQHLAALGVSIAIDDFGTGYSSLARLTSLPIQRVKLDRSFISQLDSGSPSPRTLLSRMVLMLRDLDLAVTAEGVDSTLQRDWLLAHGITSAQGYLFAPPLPLDEASGYLRRAAAGYVCPQTAPPEFL